MGWISLTSTKKPKKLRDNVTEEEEDLVDNGVIEDLGVKPGKTIEKVANGVSLRAVTMTTMHLQIAPTPNLQEVAANKSTLAEKEEVERPVWH